jgi:DNA-binding NarL/FixJ family response regulator
MALTLWLIEDNVSFRRTVQRVISHLPNIETVRCFGSFEEALAALACSNAPDIVLLDVGLPGMNGIDGIAPLKAAAPEVQILLLTAFEDDDKIFRAVCAGASGYLLKTSTTAEIATAVAEVQRGGSPMTPRVARRVLEMFAKANLPKRDYRLSPREQEILQLLVAGKTVKEAAADLGISFHTADEYIRSVYGKLQVRSRGGAVAKAVRERLVGE